MVFKCGKFYRKNRNSISGSLTSLESHLDQFENLHAENELKEEITKINIMLLTANKSN